LTYTSNIGQAIWQINFGWANHFWSLCVEEQFYLFWPFLVFACPSERQRQLFQVVCLLSLVAAGLWAILDVPGQWAGYFSVGGSSFALGIGALTAWHWRAAQRPGIMESRWVRLVALAVLCIALLFGGSLPGGSELLLLDISWSLLCTYVIVQACGNQWRLLSTPMLAFIGRISYGIYVYHLMLGLFQYQVFARLHVDPAKDRFVAFLVQVAATLLVSAASYYLYEIHFLKLKSRLA
jgi:peptidoglycan/LPS O-acetylase OafA/YrhL